MKTDFFHGEEGMHASGEDEGKGKNGNVVLNSLLLAGRFSGILKECSLSANVDMYAVRPTNSGRW